MSTRRLCEPSLSVVSLGVQSRGIAAPISHIRLKGRAFVCVRIQTKSASRCMCAHARSWMERVIRTPITALFHLPPSSTTPTPSPVHRHVHGRLHCSPSSFQNFACPALYAQVNLPSLGLRTSRQSSSYQRLPPTYVYGFRRFTLTTWV